MEIYLELVRYLALLLLLCRPIWFINVLRAIIHDHRWVPTIQDWMLGSALALLIVRGLP